MEDQKEDKPDEEEVKSNSLIKFESSSRELFSAAPVPRQFSTLPAAVDLKQPPSNWCV